MKKNDNIKRKKKVPKLDIFGLNQKMGTDAVWAFGALLVVRQRAIAVGGGERAITPPRNKPHVQDEWKSRAAARVGSPKSAGVQQYLRSNSDAGNEKRVCKMGQLVGGKSSVKFLDQTAQELEYKQTHLWKLCFWAIPEVCVSSTNA